MLWYIARNQSFLGTSEPVGGGGVENLPAGDNIITHLPQLLLSSGRTEV